jgi:broad specificity phosphatase PhoE
MGLTPAGMEDAVKLGQNFLSSPLTRLYSSPFGQWIETAYLIDRGFTRQYGITLTHNQLQEKLAPFSIKDKKAGS